MELNGDKVIIEQSLWLAYTGGKRNERGDIVFIKLLKYLIVNLASILFIVFIGRIFRDYNLSYLLFISLYLFLISSIPYKAIFIFDQEGVHFDAYLIGLNIIYMIILRTKVGKTHFFMPWDKVEYWGGNGISKHPYMKIKGLATEWTDVSNTKYSDMFIFQKHQSSETFDIYPKSDRVHALELIQGVQYLQNKYRKHSTNS